MTWTLDFENGPTDVPVISVDVQAQHSAKYTFTFETQASYFADPLDKGLEEVVAYWNGEEKLRSEVIVPREVDGTRVQFETKRGIVLDRNSTTTSYSNIAAHEAIRDYYNNFLPAGVTGSVVDPTPRELATNRLVQEADITTEFSNITSLQDTDPVTAENDSLVVEQSCFTTEGENQTNASAGAVAFTDSSFSAGDARGFQEAGGSVPGDFIEWDFTPEYTIPAASVGVQVRDRATDVCGITWTLDGNTIDTIPDSATNIALGWSDVGNSTFSGGSGYTGGDLQAGQTYTLRVEVDSISAGEDYIIDVVAPYDTRYNYTFDNTVDGNGYLSGPELFPDAATIETEIVDVTYNITDASLTTTWNDTTNNQQLEVSNTGGDTYELSVANSDTLSGSFSNPGVDARTRLTFSRFGSRTTATPTTGFNGQAISDYQLRLDGNDLAVIDTLNLKNTDFQNIKDLHRRAGMRWVMDFTGDIEIESFITGDIEKPQPAEFTDYPTRSREGLREYANDITVFGANGLEAQIEDSDEVTENGRVKRIITAPELDTIGDVKSRARSELRERIREDRVSGDGDIVPQLVLPGYSYFVDRWGVYSAVEETQFTDSDDASATLRFSIPLDTTGGILDNNVKTNNIGATLTE